MRRTIAITALSTALVVSPAVAQKKAGPSIPRQAPKRPIRPENPARELERFQKMPPAQRQKELEKLPADRRAQVEQRLARFDKMAPAQREKALKRLEAFQELTPDRRQAVRQEVQRLRDLSPEQRKTRLSSEDIKKNFSPEEQKLLHEASGEPQFL